MMVRVSVWKEREMSVLRWVLEPLETKEAVVASLDVFSSSYGRGVCLVVNQWRVMKGK